MDADDRGDGIDEGTAALTAQEEAEAALAKEIVENAVAAALTAQPQEPLPNVKFGDLEDDTLPIILGHLDSTSLQSVGLTSQL